jgi:hypothetical protein
MSFREALSALEDLHRAGWCLLSHKLAICPPPDLICERALAGIAHEIVRVPAQTSADLWRRALGLHALRVYGRARGVEIMTYQGMADAVP